MALPEAVLPPWQQRRAETGQHRHRSRIERYRRIHDRHAKGVYIKDIARTLGVGRRTVYRYPHMPEPPAVKPPARRSRQPLLAPSLDDLMQRWGEGCRNAARRWREIRVRGYPGTPSPVSKLVADLRRHECAGLTETWSNGQAAGQVHRLKPLERQTSGRAGCQSLRTRVLAA